jgi:DNA-binding MarR family transcriptional regulator
LRRATRALSRSYEEALAAVDLSSTQMTVLMFLGRQGPLPLTRVAGALEMDRTSLYRALRPLERRELVRIRATEDRRSKEVLLTVDGQRHLARAMPHWMKAQERFLGAFGASAWQDLQGSLSKVVAVTRSRP